MLRRLRTDLNLTIKEAAEAANLSAVHLQKFETNRGPVPSGERLERLAKVLRVPLDSMVQATGKVAPSVARAFFESPDIFYLLADLTPRQRLDFVAEFQGRRRHTDERLSTRDIAMLQKQLPGGDGGFQ